MIIKQLNLPYYSITVLIFSHMIPSTITRVGFTSSKRRESDLNSLVSQKIVNIILLNDTNMWGCRKCP